MSLAGCCWPALTRQAETSTWEEAAQAQAFDLSKEKQTHCHLTSLMSLALRVKINIDSTVILMFWPARRVYRPFALMKLDIGGWNRRKAFFETEMAVDWVKISVRMG